MIDHQLDFRLIQDLEQFAECRDEWNELCDSRLFHSWEWMYTWWKHYQKIGSLAIVVVHDHTGRWVGIAPWFKTRSASRGRVIRNLGTGAACSDYVGVAVRPGFEDHVASTLLSTTLGDEQASIFADVDLFEFEGHLIDEPIIQRIVQQVTPEMGRVRSEAFSGSWPTTLSKDWTEFDLQLPKSFRRKTKKASKRLQSSEFHAEAVRELDSLETAWDTFVDLHQRRREFLGQPGCFADPQFTEFLKEATFRLAETGRSQINMIYYKDQPLTCDLEFTNDDTVYMYQTGLDPNQLKLEPGYLTFTFAIQQSIERQFDCYDFLRGDEPYKSRWTSDRIELYRTQIVPNRLSSRVRNSLIIGGRQIKGLAAGLKQRIKK